MTDPVPQEQTPASPAQPAAQEISPEIQRLIAEEAVKQANAIVEKRIPGMQSAYDTQLAQVRKEFSEFKKANLTPEELANSEQSELEAQLAQARREADMLRAGRQYPVAMPVMEAMTNAQTVEDQLEILTAALVKDAGAPQQATPAQSAEAPTSEYTPPVDPNRPLTPPVPQGTGGEMTQDLADRIIAGVGDVWPTG